MPGACMTPLEELHCVKALVVLRNEFQPDVEKMQDFTCHWLM